MEEDKEQENRGVLTMQKLHGLVIKSRLFYKAKEYQKTNSEKVQEYLKNTKLPISLEQVLKQQERNSKDNEPLTKEGVRDMPAEEWRKRIAQGMVASLNNPANHGKTR